MEPSVVILGGREDEQVARVAAACARRASSVVTVDPDALQLVGFSFGEPGLRVAAHDPAGAARVVTLGGQCAVWLRHLPSDHMDPSGLDPPPTCDEVFAAGLYARERLLLWHAWLAGLADRGARLVNPLPSAAHFVGKPRQIALLRAAGVPVPRTLYTNVMTAAREFREQVGPCIVKPVLGGAFTLDFDSDEARRVLVDPLACPITVQERAPGEHLRVTVVGERVVSSVIIESDHLDYRADPRYEHESLVRPTSLSSEGVATCLAAARAAGLTFTGMDVKRDGQRHVVLECNQSPVYLEIEDQAGHPISEALAELLVSGG